MTNKKLNSGTLMLWDKVEKDTNVEFLSKKLVLNLDTTNLTVDPAMAVVGGSSKDADETQPTRPKRKLRQCTYCVRSFTEKEKLIQHNDVERALHGIIF